MAIVSVRLDSGEEVHLEGTDAQVLPMLDLLRKGYEIKRQIRWVWTNPYYQTRPVKEREQVTQWITFDDALSSRRRIYPFSHSEETLPQVLATEYRTVIGGLPEKD